MNQKKTKLSLLTALLFALMIMVAAPATSWAQGNGNGRGRSNGRHRNYDKKCGKFVNCHDARDGRIDGRGRRRGLTWRNEGFVPRGYRVRNRLNNTNGRATWTLAQRRAYARRNR
jgi:hypothetical protein